MTLPGQGEQGRDQFAGMGFFAPGVSLADGRREVLLYLPAAPTKLSVVTNAEKLRSMPQPGSPTTSLGTAEFTPKMGEIHRVEIKVEPPPPVGSKR